MVMPDRAGRMILALPQTMTLWPPVGDQSPSRSTRAGSPAVAQATVPTMITDAMPEAAPDWGIQVRSPSKS